MTSASFHLSLETPKSGWLPVLLSSNQGTLSFLASHTPYDSIGDLVGALIRIVLLETYHTSVLWNTEPEEYEFRFDSDSEQTILTIIQWPDDAFRRRHEKGRIFFTVQGSRKEIVLPFWRALRRLESNNSETWEWASPVPTHDMRELDRLVRRLRRA